MDLVLLSPRSPVEGATPPVVPAIAALAGTLAARGHRVRWLRPCTAGEPGFAPAGVRQTPVATRPAPFRDVAGRLVDLPTERALSAELRRAPPDLLQVFGYGGASSYLAPWIADRLGVPALVVVEAPAELLCHRRTLVDATGAACARWDGPERCAACCRAPGPGGLGPVAGLAARLLGGVAALSPFPAAVDFENRTDMLVSGLAAAREVRVPSPGDLERVAALGVPRRALRAGIPADPAGWEQVWEGLGH